MKTTLEKPVIEKAKFPQFKRIKLSYKEYKEKTKSIEANREIDLSHVARMTAAVISDGISRDIVLGKIKGSPILYRLDGQHLGETLVAMELQEIDCRVFEHETKESMVLQMINLNNNSKGWKTIDYVNAWTWLSEINKKFTDYKILKAALKRSEKMQETVIIMAYSQDCNRIEMSKKVKKGGFKIKSEKIGIQLIKQIEECNQYIKSSRSANQALITLMLDTDYKYNHEVFKKKLAKYPILVKDANSEKNEGRILIELNNILQA